MRNLLTPFVALFAGLVCSATVLSATPAPSTAPPVTSPDWVEGEAPAPPAFDKNKLVLLDMPKHISVKVGIDPQTISVGTDGIVHYVATMINSNGSVNAVYEGLRCNTDQVKTYARWGSSGNWILVAQPEWRLIIDNQPSPHAFVFARQAACPAHLPGTLKEIVESLSVPQHLPATMR